MMILSYTVSNYRSFRYPTTFDFSSAKDRQHPEHVERIKAKIKINKFNLVFGPNGSGKSGFVDSLDFFRELALFGESDSAEEKAFRFRENNEDLMTFKISFTQTEKPPIYQYEIHYSLSKRAIVFESFLYGARPVYSIAHGILVAKKWLEPEKKRTYFQKALSNYLKRETTKTFLAYYLPVFMKRNDDPLSGIMEPLIWFFATLTIISPEPRFVRFTDYLSKSERRKKNDALIQRFGLGITSLNLETVKEEEIKNRGPWRDQDFAKSKEQWNKELEKKEHLQIGFGYDNTLYAKKAEDGSIVFQALSFHYGQASKTLKLDEESAGTRKLVNLLPIFDLGDCSAIVVDEIDRDFHPFLTVYLTKCVKELGETTPGFQFIFTTHEFQLFDLKEFRADEIFLMEKNGETHSSSVKRLSETGKGGVRYDRDVLSSYINNQFGGLPDIKSLHLNKRKTYKKA